MATRKDFEIFLYKNKLNEKTLVDLLPRLSSRSVKSIMNDLNILSVQEDTRQLYVFTDGNCKNNGKKNAKGGYAVFFTDDTESDFYQLNKAGLVVCDPTNQKAELTAMSQLFQIIDDNAHLFGNKKVVVCTDSMYAMKCINDWCKKWEVNNWKTSKGEPVKNGELIKNILKLKHKCENNQIEITFKHVFSHTDEPSDKSSKEHMLWYGNYIVDKMINDLLATESC